MRKLFALLLALIMLSGTLSALAESGTEPAEDAVPLPSVGDVGEGIGVVTQGLVDVEEHDVEFAVVALEGLAVVAGPVVAAEEDLED